MKAIQCKRERERACNNKIQIELKLCIKTVDCRVEGGSSDRNWDSFDRFI